MLPERTTSRAITVFSPKPSRLVIDSMIRRLAWCGANTSMSAGVTPARSMACISASVSLVVAQRYTAWPAMAMYWVPAAISIAECWSPSLPQATGPMPGSSDAPTTAAPAPSAKITAVDRSVMSVTSVRRSTPMTTALRAEPARIASETRPRE